MVYAPDSKSGEGNLMSVRVRPPVPLLRLHFSHGGAINAITKCQTGRDSGVAADDGLCCEPLAKLPGHTGVIAMGVFLVTDVLLTRRLAPYPIASLDRQVIVQIPEIG